MSDKRFEISKDKYFIFDNIEDDFLDLEDIVVMLNEFEAKCHKLEKKNERLKNKLNVTAFELVDEVISMGKAVEISEMNYHEFLEYRQKKGKPMELQI